MDTMIETVDQIDKPLTYHMDLGQVREQLGVAPMKMKNVAEPERIASMIGGGLLTILGLSRRTPLGVAVSLLGGMLFHRGASGQCAMYKKLGVNTRH
jgi:uncharacterized membrane protein